MQFDKTLFTEKRNFESGERELFLTIENSVEERIEMLEQMINYKRVLAESEPKK
ncbi:MAG: hypothetical protein HOF23_11600 [Rhodospirillaceae bacterium]|nr:hypothetical protein [Rhodospirillaceae bacterium]